MMKWVIKQLKLIEKNYIRLRGTWREPTPPSLQMIPLVRTSKFNHLLPSPRDVSWKCNLNPPRLWNILLAKMKRWGIRSRLPGGSNSNNFQDDKLHFDKHLHGVLSWASLWVFSRFKCQSISKRPCLKCFKGHWVFLLCHTEAWVVIWH